jgi:hypothetical protein
MKTKMENGRWEMAQANLGSICHSGGAGVPASRPARGRICRYFSKLGRFGVGKRDFPLQNGFVPTGTGFVPIGTGFGFARPISGSRKESFFLVRGNIALIGIVWNSGN